MPHLVPVVAITPMHQCLRGVRAIPNQAVYIYWPETNGEWYVGWVSHVTEDEAKPLVVAVYGDERVVDQKDMRGAASRGGNGAKRREGAELPPDKMWRLRLRADRPVRVDRHMPTQPFANLRRDVVSYHRDPLMAIGRCFAYLSTRIIYHPGPRPPLPAARWLR